MECCETRKIECDGCGVWHLLNREHGMVDKHYYTVIFPANQKDLNFIRWIKRRQKPDMSMHAGSNNNFFKKTLNNLDL